MHTLAPNPLRLSFTRTYVHVYTDEDCNNVPRTDARQRAVDLFRSEKASKLQDHLRELGLFQVKHEFRF